MYSRNFTTDNTMNTIKLNSGLNSANKQSKIPVRSFTDNFAYERFNKMGNVKESRETSPVQDEKTEEKVISNELPVQSEAVEALSQQEEKKEQTENTILSRFKDILDSDSLLIILAVIMLLFSDNATNDKLTPLALLAILFL